MLADRGLLKGEAARVSLISWRSTRVKRVVASTLAGETLALSASIAELEWLQILFRDVVYADVNHSRWQESCGPFAALVRDSSALSSARQDSALIVDAKSVFDALLKNSANSQQDRRTAIDLAICRESLQSAGSTLKWVPHWGMASDALTEADVGQANAAPDQLMKSWLLPDSVRRSFRNGGQIRRWPQAGPLQASLRSRAGEAQRGLTPQP